MLLKQYNLVAHCTATINELNMNLCHTNSNIRSIGITEQKQILIIENRLEKI